MSEEIEEKPKRTRKKKDEPTSAPAHSNQILLRDINGLLRSLEYKYDQYGMVDWKKMLNPEFLVLNRMRYAKDGIDTYLLSKEEIEKIKSDATDDKLLVTLAGFRELARIRGYKSILPAVSVRPDGGVISECTITWMGNFETNFQEVTTRGIASASDDTVSPTYRPFLEAIASNRAFVRAVREFLGIFVVAEEEINQNELDSTKIAPRRPGSPEDLLHKICSTHNLKIDDLIQILVEMGVDIKPEWVSLESLPTSVIATLIPKIKKQVKEQKESIT